MPRTDKPTSNLQAKVPKELHTAIRAEAVMRGLPLPMFLEVLWKTYLKSKKSA